MVRLQMGTNLTRTNSHGGFQSKSTKTAQPFAIIVRRITYSDITCAPYFNVLLYKKSLNVSHCITIIKQQFRRFTIAK